MKRFPQVSHHLHEGRTGGEWDANGRTFILLISNIIFLIIKNRCFNQLRSFSLPSETTHLIISDHPYNQGDISSGVHFDQEDILLDQLFGWLPVASLQF